MAEEAWGRWGPGDERGALNLIDGEAVHVVVAENDSRTGPVQAEPSHAGSKQDGAK